MLQSISAAFQCFLNALEDNRLPEPSVFVFMKIQFKYGLPKDEK